MDKKELFRNIIYELTNKKSSKIQQELMSLYEKLSNDGQNKSGYAVESTYTIIDNNINIYLEELIKQISDCIKDYEIVLGEEEVNQLFTDIEINSFGLIESCMRKRKEYLDANELKDGRIDYKTLMIQNCTNKLNIEKNNLRIKISFIADKKKGMGISINNSDGQVNVVLDNGKIIASNNISQANNIVKLKFYLSDHIAVSDTMNKLTIRDLKEPEAITSIKQDIKELVNKINAIKLSKKVEPEKKPETINLLGMVFDKSVLSSSLYGESSAELSNDEKNKVLEQLKKYMDIEVEPTDFFCVGGLIKTTVPELTLSGFEGKTEYRGEDSEKEKNNYIEDLQLKLTMLETYYNLIDYVSGYCLIPLVLVNEGKVLNNGLEVRIKIPSKYELLDIGSKYIILTNYIFEHEDNEFMKKIFSHEENSKLSAFPKRLNIVPPNFGTIGMYQRSLEDEIKRYKKELEDLFNYELYKEKEVNIIKYSFSNKVDVLRPKEMMALPTYLFVKADELINIEYEIISNQIIDNEFEPLIYYV